MRKLKEKISALKLKKKTILVVVLLLVAAVLISSMTFYALYKKMSEETVKKNMIRFVEQKQSDIKEYFHSIHTLAYSMSYSSWMQSLFQQRGKDIRTIWEVEDNTSYFMGSVSDMNGNIRISTILNDHVRITVPHGNHLDYSIDLQQQDWYPEFQKEGVYVETGVGKGIFTRGNAWYMNIYYPINNMYSQEQMGMLVITVDEKNMEQFMDGEGVGGYLSLKDAKGNVIAENLPKRVKEKEIGQRYSVKEESIKIQNTFLSMEIVMDKEMFRVDNTNIWIGFCIVLVGMIIVFVIIGTIFSHYITTPIIKCKEALLRVRNNEENVHLENPYRDEIGDLLNGFNEMSESLHDLIEKNRMMSILQKETEYQMLLQQINPHFLYNTLEIINGLILSKKENEAVKVCETLGKIFRYNLNQCKWITIEEEMIYIRQYLLIMKYKIPDLTVYYDIEGKLQGNKILKSIMQPLVENSIKHGFYEKAGECCLTISITEEQDKIQLSVMDNGTGINQEKYRCLMNEFEAIRKNPNQRKETSVHVGIWNVFHRLYLEYGEKMEFKITAKEGKGTKIQIYLPKGDNNV